MHSLHQKFFLGLSLIALIFILISLASQWSFPDQNFPLDKGDRVKVNAPGLEQRFQATRDGLSEIRLRFSNSKVGPDSLLSLTLLDASCTQTLRVTQQSITTLSSDDTVNLSFAPLNDSRDQFYCLRVAATSTSGNFTPLIFVFANPLPYDTHLSIGGREYPDQSVSLRPAYRHASLVSDIRQLLQNLSQYKPWFLKNGWLIALILLTALTSVTLLTLLIHSLLTPPPKR